MWSPPTFKDLEHFLRCGAGPSENARVVRHLLAECSSGGHRLLDMVRDGGLERLSPFPINPREHGVAETSAPYDYTQAFIATEQALDAFFAKGKLADITPEELWAELASLPQEEQERWVMTYRRFANPRLVQKLIEMSKAARYESSTRMLHLANLARLAADACTVAADDSNP